MFTDIIDNPSKTRTVSFFLSAIPRSFHPEELRRALGEPGAVVVGNLKFLAKQSFLRSIERRGQIYYRINPRYPYLDELKGVLLKKSPVKVRDVVAGNLERLNRVTMVVLTGLFTGELQMPTDLVIVGKPSALALRNVIESVEKELRQAVNYTVLTEEEFEQRVNMYERFTRDLFDNAHVTLIDRRARPKVAAVIGKKNDKKFVQVRK